MKKTAALLFAMFFLCAACAQADDLPVFPWERDGLTHWQLDASGAVINQGNHDVGDDWICSVCRCEILDWGEGAFDVIDYDEYGNILRYTSFVDGEITYESIHVLTCSEDGALLSDKEYLDGVLAAESTFAISAAGISQPATLTTWNDDGTTSVNEYDEHGNCVRAVIYAEDGAITFETLSEFALNDEGYYYECKTTSRFDSGETFITHTNQYGDQVSVLNTYADGTAWSDSVYEYEYENGVKVWSKQYSFGKLYWEESYDAEGNCIEATEHLDDGDTVVYRFNEQGDPASSTIRAADGSVISVTTYDHVYNENLELLETRIYSNGVLSVTTLYHLDAEAGFTGYTDTIHYEDGSRTVNEYDDCMELISTTEYAADGSVLSIGTEE